MTDFQFPPGLSRGNSYSERSGRWSRANEVRWRDGRMMPIGGWSRTTEVPLIDDYSVPRKILAIRNNADIKRLIYGCDNHLLVHDGGEIVDVTPEDFVGIPSSLPDGWGVGTWGAGTWGTPRPVGSASFLRAKTWSLDAWGEDILGLCSSDGRLFRWTPTAPGDAATVVENAPSGCRAMLVTPERYVVLVGSTEFPRRVQWCDQEDYNSWEFSDDLDTAGFIDLDCAGLLHGAAKVSDGFLVFSDSDVWLARYVGPDYVYGHTVVGTGTSLLSPATIATYGASAIWMGKGGFFAYEGGVVKPLPCEIADVIFGDIDPTFSVLYSHASHVGLFNEIWFFYPSKGSQVPNRLAIYNYAEGWWSTADMTRTAMCPGGVHRPAFPIASDEVGHVYRHEDGITAAGTSRGGTVWIETDSISPGGQWAVTRAQTDSGTPPGSTSLSCRCRQTRDGPERTYGPFASRPDGYTPARAGGAEIRVRFTAVDVADWNVGKFNLDLKKVGGR